MGRIDLASGGYVDLETGGIGGPRVGRLTSGELALVTYLAERPGVVVDRDLLHVEVFGYRPGANTRAADKAVNTIRAKIERDPKHPDHLITVHNQGYRWVPPWTSASGALVDLTLRHTPVGPAPLPARRPQTGFIGRDSDLRSIRDALAASPVVTVVGPPGVGKTRLALELAREHPGVLVCDLGPARSRLEVLQRVAHTLGGPVDTESVRDALRGRPASVT